MRLPASLLAFTAAISLAGCAQLPPHPDLPPAAAAPAGSDTELDRLVGEAEARHPGASGFRLVSDGPEAFAVRARTAQIAARSLDVQTYIWNDDSTGRMLALLLLEAADRGVKVRLLVDDMNARGKNYAFAALAAHPRIDVRMFNPFATRTGTVLFAAEAIGHFGRINRRMHNKTWIADNRVAIAGGRNLGDEYFGASSELNFTDLDFAMVGPIVRDASTSFDRYWNSPLAYPMQVLSPKDVTPQALETLRRKAAPVMAAAGGSRFAEDLRNDDAVKRLVAGDWPMEWSTRFLFVSDDPAKALGKGGGLGGSQVLATLAPELKNAHERVTVISPYFVPGDAGTKFFVNLAKAGPEVRVLTNSLAANDVAMVYGGYSKSRVPLLEGGVHLWELKPSRGAAVKSSLFGSSGASLHTKALTSDGAGTFVGSYNLDPRSTSLNCEQGIFVADPVIATQLEAIFATESSSARAWKVELRDGHVTWTDDQGSYDEAPQASAGRRFQAWLARVLPLDSQL